MTYQFILPDCVYLPRKTKEDKKIMLNLNKYHTLHHQERNQMKQGFCPIELPPSFQAERIEISYQVEKPTKRRYDTMNVISIVDKCFLDWLVCWGYIPDDTCDNVHYGSITGKNQCKTGLVIATIKIME